MKKIPALFCPTLIFMGLMSLGPTRSLAQEPASPLALAAEQAQVEKRFQAQVQACSLRFAVNACVREARQERRLHADALRQREIALDDEERALKYREQLQKIADNRLKLLEQAELSAVKPPKEAQTIVEPSPRPVPEHKEKSSKKPSAAPLPERPEIPPPPRP